MGIYQQVGADVIVAMKAKEADKVSLLRMLNTALKNAAIDAKTEALDDEATLKVIKSEIKKRKDSISEYEAGGRADLADKEKSEIAMLEVYMPAAMPVEEVEKLIDAALAELAPEQKANFGAAMGAVMKKVGSAADGNVVRELLQKKLA